MSHTEGEWKHLGKDMKHITKVDNVVVGSGIYYGVRIASLGKAFKPETEEANARLIASSPNLLSACEEALACGEIEEERTIIKIQKAIDKAKGE